MPDNALQEQVDRVVRIIREGFLHPQVRTNEEIRETCRVRAQEIFDDLGIPFHVVVKFEGEDESLHLGWECSRCHKVWAPSVKQCDCKAEYEELKK